MKPTKVALIILLLIFTVGCEKEPKEFETITIAGPGFFETEICEERGLDDKVIMIGSKYCGHCEKTKPDFIETCEKKEIKPIILDLAEEEHREKLKSFGIEVHYTPTFIYGCKYYVGERTKKEYLKLCEEFLE